MEKKCEYCGNVFSTSSPKKQKYCNEDCRNAAQAKAKEEKEARKFAEEQTYRDEVVSTLIRDGLACTECGRHAIKDGVKLHVVPDGPQLTTKCSDCLANLPAKDTGEKSTKKTPGA